jgi:hypothetical protein
VIGILAGDHVSHQPRARESFLDRIGKPLGDHDIGFAVGTGVFRPHVLDHDQRRGDIFELFADFLADAMPHAAAVGAREFVGGDVMHDPLAGQAPRQRLAAVAVLRRRTRRGRRLGGQIGSRRGLGLCQDLPSEEQELSGVDPLALRAVPLVEELFELVLELLVEMNLLTERREQFADEPMGGFQVVGKWVYERGVHTPYYVDA